MAKHRFIQNRDGLPDSIIEEKRFFEVSGDYKEDIIHPEDWNNPDNWKELDEIPEDSHFAFATGNQSDYLLIDFDHMKQEDGKTVQWMLDVFHTLQGACKTYSEISVSGEGLHMIADLGDYADCFSPENNSYEQIIIAMDPDEYKALSKEERDKVPKVEFWYHTGGRCVYLTGNQGGKEKHEVAKDEEAAAIFRELLKIRDEYHETYWKTADNRTEAGTDPDKPRFEIDSFTRERVKKALCYISANCSREDWIHIGIALHHCGFPFELWDRWSQYADILKKIPCDKYNPDEMQTIWKSFKGNKSHWNAGTIIGMAKKNGFEKNIITLPEATTQKNDAVPLPKPVFWKDIYKNLPPLRPEIISGVLREGHKMMLSGPSKAGKSFALIELALAFATGGTWNGAKCKQTRVLYANLEIDDSSFPNRIAAIIAKTGISDESIGDLLKVWNLRGKAAGLSEIAEEIKEATKGCGAVILDPIYKIMEGDENSASEMALFTKRLDEIAETGAAVIFAHHFGKNTQATYKDPMSRASGSGVFARDPDAIVTMSAMDMLSVTKEIRQAAGVSGDASCFQLDFTLREFPPKKSVKIWYDYPVHVLDNGALDGIGIADGKIGKSEKSARCIGVLAMAFDEFRDQIQEDGGIDLKFLDGRVDQVRQPGKKASAKTIRNYAEDSRGMFYVDRGRLYRKDKHYPTLIDINDLELPELPEEFSNDSK